MKSAPFSLTPVFLGVMIICVILGSIIGWILSASGQGGWIIGILCGLLPIFVAGPIRVTIAKSLAATQGLAVDPPMAFNFPIRILIAAITSAAAAYVVIVIAELQLGPLSGGLIGLLTGAVMAFIMTMRIVTSD